jgi:hypothetical protein
MNLEQLKDRLDKMKTKKAILVDNKNKIMDKLEKTYKIKTTAQAKKEKTESIKTRDELIKKRDSILKEANEFLKGMEQ